MGSKHNNLELNPFLTRKQIERAMARYEKQRKEQVKKLDAKLHHLPGMDEIVSYNQAEQAEG